MQTFGGKNLSVPDFDDEEDNTSNDLSSYESHKIKQQLKDNLSALDVMTRRFKQSLNEEVNLNQTAKYDN